MSLVFMSFRHLPQIGIHRVVVPREGVAILAQVEVVSTNSQVEPFTTGKWSYFDAKEQCFLEMAPPVCYHWLDGGLSWQR